MILLLLFTLNIIYWDDYLPFNLQRYKIFLNYANFALYFYYLSRIVHNLHYQLLVIS